jgi:hypothetical protein
MSKIVKCPACGQTDQIVKVSTIYLLGIDRSRSESADALRSKLGLELSPAELKTLSHRLAPPSSGRAAPTRPVSPDLVVAVFSLIVPIFLAGIVSNQPGLFLPTLVILGLAYGIYFWQRKKIIQRFENRISKEKSEAERIEQGIAAWMKLYYCAQDDGVFEVGQGQLTPADQMMGYLLKNTSR